MNPFRNGMGMMPPWMMPMMIHEGPDRPSVPDIIVPARVNKALEFLDHLASKRRKGAAVSEHTVEVLEPDTLCDEERATQDAALQLLTRYFDGKLIPDEWEKLRFEGLKKQADQGFREARIIGCPACHPLHPEPDCPLCHGSGRLFVESCGPIHQSQEPQVEPPAEPPPKKRKKDPDHDES